MDFSVIFQLRTKKFWWMDVIFYFVMSLLVATILCWLIFLVKNDMQRKDIEKEIISLQTVGTQSQKDHEKEVINYQKKLNDFSAIFKNHGFASQVFTFLQQETRPNIWFNRFGMQQTAATVDLSGEADNNEAFSRQVAVFEKNEYVKNINILNSSLSEASKVAFNLSLSLNSKIFSYASDLQPILKAPVQTNQPPAQTNATEVQGSVPAKSSEKLMIIFKFPQASDATGAVNLADNTVLVDVPFGTDIASLAPSIVISPKAVVSPESGANQDFTNPVVYKITAEDGSTQDYVVSVKVLPKIAEKKGQFNFIIILAIILLIFAVIAAAVVAFIFYKKRLK